MYFAQYVGKDGFSGIIQGTLSQCANWADNIIRIHGEGTISITSKEGTIKIESCK